MTFDYPSTDGASRIGDEQQLYGEPCHERGNRFDEKTMYGKPQHDVGDSGETRNIELLFARLQAAPVIPETLSSDARSAAAETTDR